MVEYYVKELVAANVLEPERLAELWALRMHHRSGLVAELDDMLTQRSLEFAPEATFERILALIQTRRPATLPSLCLLRAILRCSAAPLRP